MLTAGIVGLPNVGKSTLFNALTRSHQAAAENYPFCTIEPNLGVVTVPDPRLDQLAAVVAVGSTIPTAIEFVDIAGLVKGASQGEGLGNKFLSHIREVDALIHVVRCFEHEDVHHVTGAVDPVRDIEIVATELVLADLETVRRRRGRIAKEVKQQVKEAVAEDRVLEKLEPHLDQGNPSRTLNLAREEWELARNCFLLSAKPTIYAANVLEGDLGSIEGNAHVNAVRRYAESRHGSRTLAVCAQLESDLTELSPSEAREYLAELNVEETGGSGMIRETFSLLGLRTFFTFNEKEVRAWTIPGGGTAVEAAGTIHTDFAAGFIKAETVYWEDLVKCGSVAHARETGHYRVEGREYPVKDGDVLLFKFHV